MQTFISPLSLSLSYTHIYTHSHTFTHTHTLIRERKREIRELPHQTQFLITSCSDVCVNVCDIIFCELIQAFDPSHSSFFGRKHFCLPNRFTCDSIVVIIVVNVVVVNVVVFERAKGLSFKGEYFGYFS